MHWVLFFCVQGDKLVYLQHGAFLPNTDKLCSNCRNFQVSFEITTSTKSNELYVNAASRLTAASPQSKKNTIEHLAVTLVKRSPMIIADESPMWVW